MTSDPKIIENIGEVVEQPNIILNSSEASYSPGFDSVLENQDKEHDSDQ